MNKTIIQDSSLSEVDEIASSGNFTIELIKRLGENDYDPLIEISYSLAEEYGKKYILNDAVTLGKDMVQDHPGGNN